MRPIMDVATPDAVNRLSDKSVFAFPPSFAQQRLWFLDQLLPESPAYKLSTAIRFGGRANRDAVQQSLNEIVRRHEALRTVFASVSGRPVQVILPDVVLEIPFQNYEGQSRAERKQIIRRFAREQMRPRFDLSRGPLLRASLLQFGEVEHVLLLALHHIISDAWSMAVLERELRTLYRAYATNQPSPLPELAIQYGDYAIWQRTWLQAQVLGPQLAYWKEQLEGAPHVVELMTDRPRPPVQTFRGERQTLVLPQALSAAVKASAHDHEVTLFMFLLAAYCVLLHRYSNQAEIVVGTPVANRTRTEVEELIGFFVNTLVLRVNLCENPTFSELLGRVRDVTMGAYANQDLPFEKLVEELAPERHLSHTPLFQVMFVMQNTKAVRKAKREASSTTSSKDTLFEVESGTAKFDLRLSVADSADGLIASATYNVDLWDADTISRMLGHLARIIGTVVTDPGQHVDSLAILSAAEKHQLLFDWNHTRRDFGRECCLHEWFEDAAERHPDATAVVFEDEQISFRELNRRANQLGRHLQKRGVGPEIPVGICLERSIDMIIAVLAVLKAGGAYVPLDPAYPKERLSLLIEDASMPLLISERELHKRLPECACNVIEVDRARAEIADENDDQLRSGAAPHNLAYIIYTSGSTGRPKGVLVEHRQVLNYCRAVLECLSLEECNSYAMVQPLTVDSCVTVVFPSLATGGCLHVISAERVRDPHALGEYFSRYRIDCLKIAPSHLAALQSSSTPELLMPRRRLVIGGEACRWDWARKLQALAPECRIFNHYGPTETTVGVLTYPVRAEDAARQHFNTPLGRPIANTLAYILDRHLQPVPIGVQGELYIGGLSVARGYLNRPELNTEKFIQDPFREGGSGRLYKSGDLARYLPTGDIEFLGRIDGQVKIRGFRVELGEIEAVLHLQPQIREAVVVLNEDMPNQKRLIAYIVPEGFPVPAISNVRNFLSLHLPQYMVPSAFVVLSSLPRTPHGKLDRRALPAPETSRPELKESFVAPLGSVEEALAKIWSKILGVQDPGVNDNFFELGGHSLLATQVISRLRDVFQVELPLRSLFDAPTIAGLAEVVRKGKDSGAHLSTPTIVPIAREPYRTTVTAQGFLRIPESLKHMLLS